MNEKKRKEDVYGFIIFKCDCVVVLYLLSDCLTCK